MVALPKSPEQEVVDKIYESIKLQDSKTETYLGRLGSSSIGDSCTRAVFLSWRAYEASDFGGRMLRVFGTGHWQEARIVEDLRRAGYKVWDKDEAGNQFEYIDPTGHFISKVDGVLKGYPGCVEKAHVLEIKTHNKSSFASLLKYKVQVSKPVHYTQVQSSMMLSGMNRAVYVAVCKDDEQIYVERIKEDKVAQLGIAKRIETLLNATLKPAGISEDPLNSKLCMFCSVKQVCAGVVSPQRTCRSCRASCAVEGGNWRCELKDKLLTKDEQRAACEHYEVL
jgi:hypothetical protein